METCDLTDSGFLPPFDDTVTRPSHVDAERGNYRNMIVLDKDRKPEMLTVSEVRVRMASNETVNKL